MSRRRRGAVAAIGRFAILAQGRKLFLRLLEEAHEFLGGVEARRFVLGGDHQGSGKDRENGQQDSDHGQSSEGSDPGAKRPVRVP